MLKSALHLQVGSLEKGISATCLDLCLTPMSSTYSPGCSKSRGRERAHARFLILFVLSRLVTGVGAILFYIGIPRTCLDFALVSWTNIFPFSFHSIKNQNSVCGFSILPGCGCGYLSATWYKSDKVDFVGWSVCCLLANVLLSLSSSRVYFLRVFYVAIPYLNYRYVLLFTGGVKIRI